MTQRRSLSGLWFDLLLALQFLTRIPIPATAQTPDSLPRAVKFFPLVGLMIGASAAAVHGAVASHVPRLVAAFITVVFVALSTGCLHEDGLADSADGFGGGATSDRVLTIMRDSRIGVYGAAAVAISLIGRTVLIASLPSGRVAAYLIASHMLCRWTTLPLSYFLPSARAGGAGLGAKIARLTSLKTLVPGSVFTAIAAIVLLRRRAILAILLVTAITWLSGLYYRRRIAGITGDCFGATNQLAELGVYLCGVWIV